MNTGKLEMYLCVSAVHFEGFTGRVHCSQMCICELEKCIIWGGSRVSALCLECVFGSQWSEMT